MKNYILAVLICFFAAISVAVATPEEEVAKAGEQWAAALSSNDPEKITALYDEKAHLYATFNNQLATRSEIVKYFKMLMQNKDLAVRFTEKNIRVYYGAAVNSGFYVFSYTHDGKKVSVPARFTFVYAKEPQGWKIVDHHSSVLPEEKA